MTNITGEDKFIQYVLNTSKMTNITAEDKFIQLVLDTSITLNFITTIIIHLTNNNTHYKPSCYQDWIKIRTDCLSKLSHDEQLILTEKINTNELTLLNRISNIAYSELIHAEDELWDDR